MRATMAATGGAATKFGSAGNALLPAGLRIPTGAVAIDVSRRTAADPATAAYDLDELVGLTLYRCRVAEGDRVAIAVCRCEHRVCARVVPHHFGNVGLGARQRPRLVRRIPIQRDSRRRQIVEIGAAHCKVIWGGSEPIHGEAVGIDIVRYP